MERRKFLGGFTGASLGVLLQNLRDGSTRQKRTIGTRGGTARAYRLVMGSRLVGRFSKSVIQGLRPAKLHENRSTSDKLELANDANSFDFSTT
jgi:hypothetical protein